MKPSLTARIARSPIPRDAEGLQSASRHRDEVLLQREHSECESDFEVMYRAIRSISSHEELLTSSEKGRSDVAADEFRVVKVAEHAGVGRRLHRKLMVRALPAFELRNVARTACMRTHETRKVGRSTRPNRGSLSIGTAQMVNGYCKGKDNRRRQRHGTNSEAYPSGARAMRCSIPQRSNQLPFGSASRHTL
jgi:hypothetical protein